MCYRCESPHQYDTCPNKDSLNCARCGGSHSAAYECCESSIKEEKKIQQFRAYNGVTYAAAAKNVKEETYIAPPLQSSQRNVKQDANRYRQPNKIIAYLIFTPFKMRKTI